VLFGSLQKITAQQLGFNPILIVTANSTGGVMGKMIDAQSIVVATASTGQWGRKGDPALRLLAQRGARAIMGVIVMLQAYVFPWMIPHEAASLIELEDQPWFPRASRSGDRLPQFIQSRFARSRDGAANPPGPRDEQERRRIVDLCFGWIGPLLLLVRDLADRPACDVHAPDGPLSQRRGLQGDRARVERP
jgi:hypothetical protein